MLALKTLELSEAQAAIEAGLAAAAKGGWIVALAVGDHVGELIACARMPGAPSRNLRHALRKAYTAAIMGRDTAVFGQNLEDRGGDLVQWGDARLTTLVGGLVARSDGLVVGAVACGGAPTAVDEEIARAMLRAIGLEPDPRPGQATR